MWWGGAALGPRHVVPALPFLVPRHCPSRCGRRLDPGGSLGAGALLAALLAGVRASTRRRRWPCPPWLPSEPTSWSTTSTATFCAGKVAILPGSANGGMLLGPARAAQPAAAAGAVAAGPARDLVAPGLAAPAGRPGPGSPARDHPAAAAGGRAGRPGPAAGARCSWWRCFTGPAWPTASSTTTPGPWSATRSSRTRATCAGCWGRSWRAPGCPTPADPPCWRPRFSTTPCGACEPRGYHLQNLIWHAAVVLLLFLGLRAAAGLAGRSPGGGRAGGGPSAQRRGGGGHQLPRGPAGRVLPAARPDGDRGSRADSASRAPPGRGRPSGGRWPVLAALLACRAKENAYLAGLCCWSSSTPVGRMSRPEGRAAGSTRCCSPLAAGSGLRLAVVGGGRARPR